MQQTTWQAESPAPRPSQNVVLREVAGESLLIPVAGSVAQLKNIFVLNDTGTFIWKRLGRDGSLAELARDMALEFGASEETAREDLRAFLSGLADADLLVCPDCESGDAG